MDIYYNHLNIQHNEDKASIQCVAESIKKQRAITVFFLLVIKIIVFISAYMVTFTHME